MPELEYKAILARPGVYTYKDGTKREKTWDELKKSFQRSHELPLTLGHPLTPDKKYRPPTVREFLGVVTPIVINEEKQIIEGWLRPYSECWGMIPPHIQERLVNDLPSEISLGFTSQTIDNKHTGMLHNHVALLVNGEIPVCPLGECGVNVHAEALDEGDDVVMTFYEQATNTKEDPETEEEKSVETPAAPAEFVTKSDFNEFATKVFELLQPKVPEESAPLEEEKSTPEAEEEPVKEPPQAPSVEPEPAFPAGSISSTKKKFPYLNDEGAVEVPSDIYLGGTRKQ